MGIVTVVSKYNYSVQKLLNSKLVNSIIQRFKSIGKPFLIGTAASAHQVEGNTFNDWTKFENEPRRIVTGEKSGRATDHYYLYKKDFSILEDLGFQSHRLSIEWSRIIPEPNKIDLDEIKHYRNVLSTLKEHNQLNFTTLHHFTSPVWFMDKGGFEKHENLKHWYFFVKTVCEHLGDLIDVFNTINEPSVYATTGYLQGFHPPGKKSIFSYIKVMNNLIRAHFHAVKIIRVHCPKTPVGIVKNLIHFQPYRWWSPIDVIANYFSDWSWNSVPKYSLLNGRVPFGFEKIRFDDYGDFIGVNFYVHMTVGLELPDFGLPHRPDEENLTQMGWGINPESMMIEIKKLAETFKIPIFITENGIATDNDEERIKFITSHLNVIAKLIELGIDIRGYFYWSNIDNFEWVEGYKPKFGLIGYDPDTFERKVKPSAKFLGKIATELVNGINKYDVLRDLVG